MQFRKLTVQGQIHVASLYWRFSRQEGGAFQPLGIPLRFSQQPKRSPALFNRAQHLHTSRSSIGLVPLLVMDDQPRGLRKLFKFGRKGHAEQKSAASSDVKKHHSSPGPTADTKVRRGTTTQLLL